MPPISRGFGGRPRRDVDPSRVPPGQYVVEDFPVLSAGPDAAHLARAVEPDHRRRRRRGAHVELGPAARAALRDVHDRHPLRHEVDQARHDLDRRVARHAARGVETEAEYLTAWCDGDYTTNLTIEDVSDGKAWIAYDFDGEPLDPEHGGPARLLVPHLYLWKSAKWIRRISFTPQDEPGFWEAAGYHNHGDPWREQRYWND